MRKEEATLFAVSSQLYLGSSIEEDPFACHQPSLRRFDRPSLGEEEDRFFGLISLRYLFIYFRSEKTPFLINKTQSKRSGINLFYSLIYSTL